MNSNSGNGSIMGSPVLVKWWLFFSFQLLHLFTSTTADLCTISANLMIYRTGWWAFLKQYRQNRNFKRKYQCIAVREAELSSYFRSHEKSFTNSFCVSFKKKKAKQQSCKRQLELTNLMQSLYSILCRQGNWSKGSRESEKNHH